MSNSKRPSQSIASLPTTDEKELRRAYAQVDEELRRFLARLEALPLDADPDGPEAKAAGAQWLALRNLTITWYKAGTHSRYFHSRLYKTPAWRRFTVLRARSTEYKAWKRAYDRKRYETKLKAERARKKDASNKERTREQRVDRMLRLFVLLKHAGDPPDRVFRTVLDRLPMYEAESAVDRAYDALVDAIKNGERVDERRHVLVQEVRRYNGVGGSLELTEVLCRAASDAHRSARAATKKEESEGTKEEPKKEPSFDDEWRAAFAASSETSVNNEIGP